VAAWRQTLNDPHIGLGPRAEVRIEQTATEVADRFPRLCEQECWQTGTQEQFTSLPRR